MKEKDGREIVDSEWCVPSRAVLSAEKWNMLAPHSLSSSQDQQKIQVVNAEDVVRFTSYFLMYFCTSSTGVRE